MSSELDPLFKDIERHLKDPAGLMLPTDKDESHAELFERENPSVDGVQLIEYFNIASYDQFESNFPGIGLKIKDCVDSAFKGRVGFDDTRKHIAGDILIVGTDEHSRVACFSSAVAKSPNESLSRTDLTDEIGWYMAAAAVRQEAQSSGLYKEMTRRRVELWLNGIENRKLTLLYTRTQNPRVEEGIVGELEDRITTGQIKGFSLERRPVPCSYGQMLTAEIPIGRCVVYDTLDYSRGDAHVLLFRIERPTAK